MSNPVLNTTPYIYASPYGTSVGSTCVYTISVPSVEQPVGQMDNQQDNQEEDPSVRPCITWPMVIFLAKLVAYTLVGVGAILYQTVYSPMLYLSMSILFMSDFAYAIKVYKHKENQEAEQ